MEGGCRCVKSADPAWFQLGKTHRRSMSLLARMTTGQSTNDITFCGTTDWGRSLCEGWRMSRSFLLDWRSPRQASHARPYLSWRYRWCACHGRGRPTAARASRLSCEAPRCFRCRRSHSKTHGSCSDLRQPMCAGTPRGFSWLTPRVRPGRRTSSTTVWMSWYFESASAPFDSRSIWRGGASRRSRYSSFRTLRMMSKSARRRARGRASF